MTSTELIFLRLERNDYPMDVVTIFILEPADAGALAFAQVKEHLVRRMRGLPLFRKKIARAPLGIGDDRWTEASPESFGDQIHRVTANAPGEISDLLDVVLEVYKHPLTRDRPLWDAWYVEGLSDGRTALTLRIHHALADGIGILEVLGELFDTEPNPAPEPAAASPTPPVGAGEPPVAWRVVREVPDRVVSVVGATERIAGHAVRALNPVQPLMAGAGAVVRRAKGGDGVSGAKHTATPGFVPSASHGPPVTLFNQHVTIPEKSLAVISLPLAEVKKIRSVYPDVTVNDVLLTLVTGTLRSYLSAHDDLPDRPLRTSCPVNIRRGGEAKGEGNNFTTMWIDLPVQLDDTEARLLAVHASAAAAKAELEESQTSWEVLADVGNLLLPGVVSAVMSFAHTKAFTMVPPTLNLTVSTMVGSKEPYYLCGRMLEHFYWRTIVCPPVHLFFYATSYAGSVEFGVTTVKQLVPDPEVLTQGLRTELDALLALPEANSMPQGARPNPAAPEPAGRKPTGAVGKRTAPAVRERKPAATIRKGHGLGNSTSE